MTYSVFHRKRSVDTRNAYLSKRSSQGLSTKCATTHEWMNDRTVFKLDGNVAPTKCLMPRTCTAKRLTVKVKRSTYYCLSICASQLYVYLCKLHCSDMKCAMWLHCICYFTHYFPSFACIFSFNKSCNLDISECTQFQYDGRATYLVGHRGHTFPRF